MTVITPIATDGEVGPGMDNEKALFDALVALKARRNMSGWTMVGTEDLRIVIAALEHLLEAE